MLRVTSGQVEAGHAPQAVWRDHRVGRGPACVCRTRARQVRPRADGDRRGRHDDVLVARGQQGRQHEAAAGRVAPDRRPFGSEPLLVQPGERGYAVVHRGGKRVFRGEAVIGEQDRGLGRTGNFTGQRTVGLDRADDVAAAVQVQEGAAGPAVRGADPFRGAAGHAERFGLDVRRGREGELLHALAHGFDRRLDLGRGLFLAQDALEFLDAHVGHTHSSFGGFHTR